MATAKLKNPSYYVWSVVSLLFMFCFGFVVPEFAGINAMGVNILGIFFGVLIATITTGETFWPAVLGLFAMVMWRFQSAGQLLGTWFGNTTIQQIIWVMALTGAVTESGAVDVLSRKMLRLKFVQGKPMALIIGLFLAVLVCSALVSSPTAMLLLWYPILDGICKMCGIKDDSDLKRELLLGIYISAMGAYILPFKGVQLSSIAIITGIMKGAGLEFNSLAFFITCLLVVLGFVLVYALFIKFVWRTDLSALKEFRFEKLNLKEEDLKMTKKQKVVFGFLVAGIVFLLVSMFLPRSTKDNPVWITDFYNKIGSTWVWVMLFGVLCFMRNKDGTQFINGVKLLQSKTMWGIIAVAGCFTICGQAIASADYGIRAAVETVLKPVMGNASWPIMVFVMVLISTVFTNITNGMPVNFTINAVCIPLACTMGASFATVLGAAGVMAGMCAFMTNGAIAYAPILLGREEMTNKFIWTKGAVTNGIFVVVCTVLCVMLGHIF
jgi:sodium-dependent dicarboxylate transporter 2/3/5